MHDGETHVLEEQAFRKPHTELHFVRLGIALVMAEEIDEAVCCFIRRKQ